MFLHVVDAMLWVVGNKSFFVPCVVRDFKALNVSISMAHYTPHALNSMHIKDTSKILQEKETHAIDL
jgi:hypothetical protein